MSTTRIEMKKALHLECCDVQKEYEKKFGDNTIVLTQVGSFFEIYELDLTDHPDYPNGNTKMGKVREISTILDMQVTKKDKKPHSIKNPLMLGFPTYRINKYINKLIQNNYTVLKFIQIDRDDDNKKDRILEKIYSVGTHLNNNTSNTNFMISLYIEKMDGQDYHSICGIDLSTGTVKLFETFSTKDNPDRAQDETFRFIHSLAPSEILIRNVEIDKKKIVDDYKLNNINVHFIEQNKDYEKLAYQQQILCKVYEKDNCSILESLSLEKYPELTSSFIYLLQYAYEHDNNIIFRLKEPEFINTDKKLILNRDSIYQLNIISSDRKKFSSIFNLVNFTSTNMGRRLLKERLLNPITSKKELSRRFDKIEKYQKNDLYTYFSNILKDITDLEKKHRKGILKRLSPHEFAGMIESYQKIQELFEEKELQSECKEYKKEFNNFLHSITSKFDLNKMSNIYSINQLKTSIFQPNVYIDIDYKQNDIDNCMKYFRRTQNKLCDLAEKKRKENSVKLEYKDSEGYYLQTTLTRFKRFENKVNDLEVKKNKNSVKITSVKFRKMSEECRKLEGQISEMVKKEYTESIVKLFIKYSEMLHKVVYFISELDVFCSSAKCALKYSYKRPIIVSKKKGMIVARDIRHPLIEQIIDTEYVTNNVSLGRKSNILVYGHNGCGKSSLLKSVGCNVVLAQAGLFVACKKFQLSPFTLLFSKIITKDDIFRSQSTFVYEMNELRSILKGSNEKSLILADELCAGTESISATSIVASALMELTERKSSFLFSTHLHSLSKLKQINEMKELKICHFETDTSNGVKYIRKLKDGSGDSLYGLEIAKSMGMNNSFVKNAFLIRATLEKRNVELLPTKKSRYNANLYIDECYQCGKTLEDENLHTHHIVHQQDANEKGIVKEKYHKNRIFNLKVLCSSCHVKEHKDTKEMYTF